jgi:hypothetical protein
VLSRPSGMTVSTRAPIALTDALRHRRTQLRTPPPHAACSSERCVGLIGHASDAAALVRQPFDVIESDRSAWRFPGPAARLTAPAVPSR